MKFCLMRTGILLFVSAVVPAVTPRMVFAETNPPVLVISSVDIFPDGKRTAFSYNVTASDDTGVAGLEYRARVDRQPFSQWFSFPYVENFPLFFSVNCSFFEAEIRAIDTSGNVSAAASRSFKAPFKEPAGKPLVPGQLLEDPPKVVVNNNNVIFIMKNFAAPRKKDLAATGISPALSAAAKKKKKKGAISYETTITSLDTGQIVKKLSKRNTLTLRNQQPGAYSASYNVKFIQRKEVKAASGESPAEFFSVGRFN